jgi:hypothetical protein
MTEITLSQPPSSDKRRSFWIGLLLGLLGMFVTVALLWFFGVLNFPGSTDDSDTLVEVPIIDGDVEEMIVEDEPAVAEETLEDLDKESKEETTSQASKSPFIASVVTAKDISEEFEPVDQTSLFQESDESIYVIITLTGDIKDGTPVGVEWFREGTKVSDFSTDLESGQRLVYFFMTNQGPGDYNADILIDGKKADSVKFVVK